MAPTSYCEQLRSTAKRGFMRGQALVRRRTRRFTLANPKRERGTTSLELSLLLPVFLMTTLGVVDFSRGVWAKGTIMNAVREGTRYASVRSERSGNPALSEAIADRVRSQAVGLDPEAVDVTTTWLPTNNPGSIVRVVVSYEFEPIVPLPGIDTIELTSSSEMIVSF